MSALRVTIEPVSPGDVIRVTGTVPPKETEKEPKVYRMDTSLEPVTNPLVIEIEGGEKLAIECEMLQRHEYDKEQFAAVKIPPDVTLGEYKQIESEKNAKEAKKLEDEEEKRTGAKKKHEERVKQLKEDSDKGRTTPVGGRTDEEVRAKTSQGPFPAPGGAQDSHDVKGEARKEPNSRRS